MDSWIGDCKSFKKIVPSFSQFVGFVSKGTMGCFFFQSDMFTASTQIFERILSHILSIWKYLAMVYFVYVISSERKTDNKSFFHLVKVLATAIIQILFALRP